MQAPTIYTRMARPPQDGTSRSRQPEMSRSRHAALAEALDRVGDRWTLLVIAALLDGPRRFGEIQEELPGIAPNILTQRLRQLERDALVVARAYSDRPPRFTYELSTSGQELAGVLRLLAGWGARSSGQESEIRHSVCGTSLEARWWCPTCEQPVGEDEGEELHFA
jgi:DNA-binding HxlR family transcriptional regulator